MTLDQARYCKAIVNRFLEKVVPKRILDSISLLPTELNCSVEDCSKDAETAKTSQEEYRVDYTSCVGDLLHLSYTRPSTTYAIA